MSPQIIVINLLLLLYAPETFADLQWQRGKTGCPILADCIAYFEGRIVDRYRPGNHTLFFAEVVDAGYVADTRPLTSLDYDGVYLGQH